MDIFASLAEDLSALSEGVGHDGPGLDQLLQTLVDDLRLVVRSYLGLSLTLRQEGFPVTLTELEDHAATEDIRTSLRLPLTALAEVEDGSVLDFYAAKPGAFVDFAADLCHALKLSPDRVVLDQHLTPPATGSALTGANDLSHINQAVGILIGRGHTPEDARTELRRRAHRTKTTVPHAAHQLIRETVTAALG